MDTFSRLMAAQTTTEFFVIISSLINSHFMSNIRTKVESIVVEREHALKLSIEQTLGYPQPDGHQSFRSEVTNVFTLSESGELTWWMKDQPTLVGLKAIQAAFKQRWSSLANELLPNRV